MEEQPSLALVQKRQMHEFYMAIVRDMRPLRLQHMTAMRTIMPLDCTRIDIYLLEADKVSQATDWLHTQFSDTNYKYFLPLVHVQAETRARNFSLS